jgi:transposase-like protein
MDKNLFLKQLERLVSVFKASKKFEVSKECAKEWFLVFEGIDNEEFERMVSEYIRTIDDVPTIPKLMKLWKPKPFKPVWVEIKRDEE